MSNKIFGGNFNPNKLDLFLALFTAFLMPLICYYLYQLTGALIPLIIYYLIFCVGIVKWRKGTLDYRIPDNFWNYIFLSLLAIEGARLIIGYRIYEPIKNYQLFGFLLTLFIWAPVNAFMEQLSWLYVFDSWANYFDEGVKKYLSQIIGFVLYIILIGLIHALFWGKFLFESESIFPLSQIYFVGQMIIAVGYIFLYRKTESMLQVAIIHLIVDISAVLFTRYSILPYLLS
ncbi:MAG: hypothetical protein ACOCSL_05460 [Thermoplasmatota archaeon]